MNTNFFAAGENLFLLSPDYTVCEVSGAFVQEFNIDVSNDMSSLGMLGSRFIENGATVNKIKFRIEGQAMDIRHHHMENAKQVQNLIYKSFTKEQLLKALYRKIDTGRDEK